MGMYTGLRVKAYIKPEYLEMVESIVERDVEWNHFDYDFLNTFGKLSRASFIPFGAMSYMPEDWKNKNYFYKNTGVWDFACSLKNYDNEIEEFLNNVLTEISISATAERLYEEEIQSALYSVFNGKLTCDRESRWEE